MADFGRLLKKASAQMTRRFNRFASQYRLTAMQMSIIDFMCLHQGHEILQRDVEHEFLIRRSTASVLLKRMAKHGLLVKQASHTDARQRQLKLTPKALQLEHVITGYMRNQQYRINHHFTKSEVQLLNRLLKILINHS